MTGLVAVVGEEEEEQQRLAWEKAVIFARLAGTRRQSHQSRRLGPLLQSRQSRHQSHLDPARLHLHHRRHFHYGERMEISEIVSGQARISSSNVPRLESLKK